MASRPLSRGWLASALTLLAGLALLAFAGDRWAAARARGVADAAADAAARAHAALLTSELQKFRLLPLVLAEYPDVRAALSGDEDARSRLDATLELLSGRTDAANIYVIGVDGRTVAANNYRLPTSFVGQDYGFRPYFRDALRTGTSELFALGTVSRRPGLYLARRVDVAGRALGVIVVKVEFDAVEAAWRRSGGASFVVGEAGVVLVTSRPEWRFRVLGRLSPGAAEAARRTLQFGDAVPRPAPIRTAGRNAATADGTRFRIGTAPAPLAGARLLHLSPLAPELAAARSIALLWGLAGLLVAGVAVTAVIRSAERRRLQAQARERLEREVAERTVELRDANARLQIESDERVEADRRYRAAREELAQANRLGTLGQITAGVAHEINQPVAAIRTFAESGTTLIDRGAPDTARGNLRHIVELADRIGAITAELRGFARRRTPAGGTAVLGPVISGVRRLMGERARGRLTVTVAPELRDAVMTGDRVRIEQILVNLVQNALDAIGEDGGVTLAAQRDGDQIKLTVTDTGPGVAADLVDGLFTPFASNKPGGLGLGLAIARDIAREFDGELAYRDTGHGAAFDLTLKVAG